MLYTYSIWCTNIIQNSDDHSLLLSSRAIVAEFGTYAFKKSCFKLTFRLRTSVGFHAFNKLKWMDKERYFPRQKGPNEH